MKYIYHHPFTEENATTALKLHIKSFSDHLFQDPEGQEIFNIKIVNVTGRASFIQPTTAKLTIEANDYPVTLNPSHLNISEGGNGTLYVQLAKKFSEDIYISVAAMSVTANDDDFPLLNRSLIITAGESTKEFVVQVTNDDIPELSESFRVMLISATGDTSLLTNNSSLITIPESDDPNGVIEFSEDLLEGMEEGQNATIR